MMSLRVSKFIITCAPRTGSTMLRMMLNSHPDILCHGEVISLNGLPNLGKKYQEEIAQSSEDLARIRDEDPVNFLYNYVWNQQNCKAIGAKLKYRQLEEQFQEVFKAILKDSSVLIIHLTRKNLLKRYVSNRLAGSNKTPTVITDRSNHGTPGKIFIDPQRCMEDISSFQAAETRFREYFQRHQTCEAVYEDLVIPGSHKLVELQNFLGVNPITLKPKTIKINSNSLEDNIENYEELKKIFKTTPYAQYLD